MQHASTSGHSVGSAPAPAEMEQHCAGSCLASGALVTETIEAGQEHALASTSTSHAGGGTGDGGSHCGSTLEAKSTGNHCGGTAPLSDGRAWAVEKCELGLDEIGLTGLVPVSLPARMRPCHKSGRGVVTSAGWNAGGCAARVLKTSRVQESVWK